MSDELGKVNLPPLNFPILNIVPSPLPLSGLTSRRLTTLIRWLIKRVFCKQRKEGKKGKTDRQRLVRDSHLVRVLHSFDRCRRRLRARRWILIDHLLFARVVSTRCLHGYTLSPNLSPGMTQTLTFSSFYEFPCSSFLVPCSLLSLRPAQP